MTDNILNNLIEFNPPRNTLAIKIEGREPFMFTITSHDEDLKRVTVKLFGEAGFSAVCRGPTTVTFRYEPTVWQRVKSKIKSIW